MRSDDLNRLLDEPGSKHGTSTANIFLVRVAQVVFEQLCPMRQCVIATRAWSSDRV